MTNFQIITSSRATSRCMRAYSRPVTGCAVTDFVFGSQCSASCVRGLEAAAARIEEACADDRDAIDADSLLGMIVTGHLVEVLCPRNQQTTITTTVRPSTTLQPTPSAGQDTDVQDPITTTRDAPKSSTREASPTTEPTRGEQSTRITPTAPSTTTDSAAEPDDTTTTTLPTFSLGTSPTNTITLTPSTTAADDDAPAPSETSDAPEDGPDSDGPGSGVNPTLLGSGSPFDPLAVSAGPSLRHQMYGALASALAAGAAAAVLSL